MGHVHEVPEGGLAAKYAGLAVREKLHRANGGIHAIAEQGEDMTGLLRTVSGEGAFPKVARRGGEAKRKRIG